MKKVAIIRKCKKGDAEEGKPYCLYTHDGSRLLGRHPSRGSAEKQEAAIKAQGTLQSVVGYLRAIELRTAVSWKEYEEERGETRQEHAADPDEGLAIGIDEDLDEWKLVDLIEYARELQSKGLFTDPGDFDSLSEEASAVAGSPVELTTLDDVYAFIELHEEGQYVQNELGVIIRQFVMSSPDEKAEWKDILKNKFMPPEETFGYRD